MRDNFTQLVKRKLAERVAWKCSFPGCGVITIGPNHKDSHSTLNLGEAAHIHAASINGPRYNPEMSTEMRKSIDNGIWMCRSHGKLIDGDYTIYSAATIVQWKKSAEKRTYKQLKELTKEPTDIPLTLISIGSNIVFEGSWVSVRNNDWTFEVHDFLIGNLEKLKEFFIDPKLRSSNGFIVIETQGDGRVLQNNFSWNYNKDKYQIEVSVKDKEQREDPNKIGGGIALGEDGDLFFENGDLRIITGIEYAKQLISNTLSTGFGELFQVPTLGSNFSKYYWKFKNDPDLLNRILKLEITRLISIPLIEFDSRLSKPPLNFINRIISVEILDKSIQNQRISAKMKLEWGNGIQWEDIINVYLHNNK